MHHNGVREIRNNTGGLVMKKLTAVIVGYGDRGYAYGTYSVDHPDELEIVGVAEPNPVRRETAQKRHNQICNNLPQKYLKHIYWYRLVKMSIVCYQYFQ
jgi:hypothetical protein